MNWRKEKRLTDTSPWHEAYFEGEQSAMRRISGHPGRHNHYPPGKRHDYWNAGYNGVMSDNNQRRPSYDEATSPAGWRSPE